MPQIIPPLAQGVDPADWFRTHYLQMYTISDADAAQVLHALLAGHGAMQCPACQHPLGFGDITWHNAETEYRTGYGVVEIQCAVCATLIEPYICLFESEIWETIGLLHVIDQGWD